MKSLSLKLPDALDAKLGSLAERRRSTKSELLREALEAGLVSGQRLPEVSCYDLSKHLCGCIEGRPDSATNEEYMRGFGE